VSVREEGSQGSVRNAGIAGNIDLVANAILAMENSFWVLAFVVSKWVRPVMATVKTAVQPGQSIPDSSICFQNKSTRQQHVRFSN
jgi:hypothetical protein